MSDNLMREWYCSMGLVYRNIPADDGTSRICGVTVRRNEWPVLFNLTGIPANVEFTTYYEDSEPMTLPLSVKPHEAYVLSLHEMDEFADGKLMAFRVTSDQSILPQFSYSEDGIPVPGTSLFMSGAGSRHAHPGPLGSREQKWAHADGHTRPSDIAMADLDWFTIFNPHKTQTATIQIELCWANQVITSQITVPPQRVRVYKPGGEAGFHFSLTFGSIFTSSTPVIVEAVRRFAQNQPFVSLNQWTAPAVAIG